MKKNACKIILGTVQFGINYGISNTNGVPSDQVLQEILSVATLNGVQQLDTAFAYGNSEERLGDFANGKFQLITKFPNVVDAEELKDFFLKSLQRLKVNSVYGYLAHNADLLIQKPELWELLQKFKEQNLIKKIGFSLYHPEQLDQLLSLKIVPDIVQLPYSIFDKKFESSLSVLKDIGTEIHVRSVFLQGLYFMNPKQLPEKLLPLEKALSSLHKICGKYDLSIGDVALNYVASNHKIDKIVIGVENAGQLNQNISAVRNWDQNSKVFQEIDKIEVENKSLLNPVNW